MMLDGTDIWKRRWFLDGGDLMPAILEYIQQKRVHGHSCRSLRLISISVRHFGYWLKAAGISPRAVDHHIVTRFATHKCSCPGGRRDQPLQHNYVLCVRAFVKFLARHERNSSISDPFDIEGYSLWCSEQRGLTEKTIAANRKTLRFLLPKAPRDLRDSTAVEVRDYVVSLADRYATSTMNTTAAIIRRYLKYNRVIGRTSSDNFAAIPRFALWSAADIPKYLEPGDLEKLFAVLDDDTPVQARDKAIILTIAALGLRPSDISNLRVRDIDWHRGTIRVGGKGRREIDLPLPQNAGDAISAYIDVHRIGDGELLFRKMIAPFDKPLCADGVSFVVRRAVERAGLVNAPIKGGYLLRHTAATEMIRSGASLDAVSSVLRHKVVTTTMTYAKVDDAMLRAVAMPWPGAGNHA